MPNKFIIIFVTASSEKEAKRIISQLIKKKIIACANILKGIDSTFIWKGNIDNAKEVLIMLKTKKALFKKAAREIERLHSYDVPEIIAVPIVMGSKKYLDWIDESTQISTD